MAAMDWPSIDKLIEPAYITVTQVIPKASPWLYIAMPWRVYGWQPTPRLTAKLIGPIVPQLLSFTLSCLIPSMFSALFSSAPAKPRTFHSPWHPNQGSYWLYKSEIASSPAHVVHNTLLQSLENYPILQTLQPYQYDSALTAASIELEQLPSSDWHGVPSSAALREVTSAAATWRSQQGPALAAADHLAQLYCCTLPALHAETKHWAQHTKARHAELAAARRAAAAAHATLATALTAAGASTQLPAQVTHGQVVDAWRESALQQAEDAWRALQSAAHAVVQQLADGGSSAHATLSAKCARIACASSAILRDSPADAPEWLRASLLGQLAAEVASVLATLRVQQHNASTWAAISPASSGRTTSSPPDRPDLVRALEQLLQASQAPALQAGLGLATGIDAHTLLPPGVHNAVDQLHVCAQAVTSLEQHVQQADAMLEAAQAAADTAQSQYAAASARLQELVPEVNEAI